MAGGLPHHLAPLLGAVPVTWAVVGDARGVGQQERETVTVLRLRPTEERLPCRARGGLSEAVALELRSQDPPPGRPAELRWVVCPGVAQRGDTLEVVRTDDAEDPVRVAPVVGAGRQAGAVLAVAGPAGLVIALFLRRRARS